MRDVPPDGTSNQSSKPLPKACKFAVDPVHIAKLAAVGAVGYGVTLIVAGVGALEQPLVVATT